jgi:hypothetical protein
MDNLDAFITGATSGVVLTKTWRIVYKAIVIAVGGFIAIDNLIRIKKERPVFFKFLMATLIFLVVSLVAGGGYAYSS